MTYNICMKKSTISKLVDFVLVCVFKRLSLFVASWLVLCYLMSRSVVRIPLKCIWIEFHEIWFALQFTNAYVDIILCDFNTVGQTSPHWWQPPRHCIYFDFKQYMCVLSLVLHCLGQSCIHPELKFRCRNSSSQCLVKSDGPKTCSDGFGGLWHPSGNAQTSVCLVKLI